MRYLASILLAVLLPPSMDRAGCKSNCRETYVSEVDSCKMQESDPDANTPRLCVERAKDDYESCLDECEE